MNPIAPKNAQVELETGKALMIDLREPMDFEFVSFDIDGVFNIPLRKLPEAIHKFQKAKRLICADFDETIAPKAAMMLEYNGFLNVVYLEGGMKNWNREHLPLKYNVEGSCDEGNCHSCSGCGQ